MTNKSDPPRASDDRAAPVRLAVAAVTLAGLVAAALTVAHLGDLRVGAGDVNIHVGRGDQGLVMGVAARTCPPHCGFDFDWRPSVRRAG